MIGVRKVYSYNPFGSRKVLVTIGLCVRNEQSTIEKTLKSIREQVFPRELMELIVVDDGSEDHTLQIVLSLISESDLSVTVFSTEWKGIGAARNVVVKNANGKYVIWVDGGMVLSKDYVSRLVEFMEKNPKVGIAKGKCRTLDNRTITSLLESLQFLAVDMRYDGNVEDFVIGTGGAIYRIEAIREVGGFNVNFKRSGEDLDAENKVKNLGWLIYRTSATFEKKHHDKLALVWRDNIKYGYGGHHLITIYKGNILRQFKKSIFHGLLNAKAAYKLTYKKEAFLLPLYYAFMKIAWIFGVLKAYVER